MLTSISVRDESTDTGATLSNVVSAEGMEPYWSLIRADSVHPVKRAESLVGARVARAAASARRKRENSSRVSLLVVGIYERSISESAGYPQVLIFCSILRKKEVPADIWQRGVKGTEDKRKTSVSFRDRLDCESSCWLMRGIKLSLLAQLSVCISVSPSTNTVALRVRNSTAIPTVPRGATRWKWKYKFELFPHWSYPFKCVTKLYMFSGKRSSFKLSLVVVYTSACVYCNRL